MSRFKKLTHTFYDCKHHIVFCLKYRYKIFRDNMLEYTRQTLLGPPPLDSWLLREHIFGLDEEKIRKYVKYHERIDRDTEEGQQGLDYPESSHLSGLPMPSHHFW